MKDSILNFDLQPSLADEWVTMRPLFHTDFDDIYKIASDPLIWEQHPNHDRYKLEVFRNFFNIAVNSQGAFLVCDTKSKEIIGSTRYYDLDLQNKSVAIGYTFLSRHCWGKPYNRSLKILMLNHAFKLVEKVFFHIGVVNIRSQKAVEKLGAEKISEVDYAVQGEPSYPYFLYELKKSKWMLLTPAMKYK